MLKILVNNGNILSSLILSKILIFKFLYMPGNEDHVISYLVESSVNDCTYELPYLGILDSVSMPDGDEQIEIRTQDALLRYSSSDRYKKADVYINNVGISIKEPVSPLYNKMQRKHITALLDHLLKDTNRTEEILNSLDSEISKVNEGGRRDVYWRSVFLENEFKLILEFLMMKGYADLKISHHPADYILVAPKRIGTFNAIKIYSFDEYFENYKDTIVLAARRIWTGNASNSENRRAFTMIREPLNCNWVFDNISGNPRKWDPSFPVKDRREIFYFNVNVSKTLLDKKLL